MICASPSYLAPSALRYEEELEPGALPQAVAFRAFGAGVEKDLVI